MNADVSDIVEMLIELLFLGFGVWGTILLVKEKSRAYTLLAAAAVALGLLLGVSGIIHTGAVIGAALKNKKPYDFRLVSLIATGLILVYFGSLNIGISRGIKQGRPWAIAMSGVVTFYLWVYLGLLAALGRQGSTFLVVGFYLFFLLTAWNSSREAKDSTPGVERHWQSIRQTGTTLALFAVAMQFALSFGFRWLRWPTDSFIAGPLYGWLLAGLFSVAAVYQGRALARRLAGAQFALHLGFMAAAVVLVTASFRVALELCFRVGSGGGIRPTQPTFMDVFVYGTMVASMLAAAH